MTTILSSNYTQINKMDDSKNIIKRKKAKEKVLETVESALYQVDDTKNYREKIKFMKNKHVIYSKILDWFVTSLIAITVAFVGLAVQFTPMAHIGAAIGYLINQLLKKPRRKLENDPNYHPTRSGGKSMEADDRDAVAAGAGCGLTVIFNAPIGGSLFYVEETGSFLNISTIRRNFYSCFLTYGLVVYLQISNGTFSFLSEKPANPFCNERQIKTLDLFMFALIGILGGILGSLFNKCIKYTSKINWDNFGVYYVYLKLKKFYYKDPQPVKTNPAKLKWRRIEFTLILAILVSSTRVFLPLLFSCKNLDSDLFLLEQPSLCLGISHEKLMFSGISYLGNAQHNTSSIFNNHQDCKKFSRLNSVQSLQKLSWGYQEVEDEEDVLMIVPQYAIPTKPGITLDRVLPIPLPNAYPQKSGKSIPVDISTAVRYNCPAGQGGTQMPALVLGAVFGRMMGFIGTYISNKYCSNWLFLPPVLISEAERLAGLNSSQDCLKLCATASDPLLYAIVGAASMLGGVNRSPLYCAVVVSELFNDLDSLPSIAIGVFISVSVGNFFNRGLNHTLIDSKIPLYLNEEAPLNFESREISSVMTKEVICIKNFVQLSEIITILEDQSIKNLNAFPVYKEETDTKNGNKIFVGLVYRKKLDRLIKSLLKAEKVEEVAPTDVDFDKLEKNFNEKEIFLQQVNLDSEEDLDKLGFPEIGKLIKSNKIEDLEEEKVIKSENIASVDCENKVNKSYISLNLNVHVDLTNYMELSQFCVLETFSLGKAYRYFRTLGLRYIVVVDSFYCIKGIVTRKDLNSYKLKM
ncbi:hypothetical protein HK099_001299 [Clydaea vesicula]|uniref:CBS domain-containing protein n=1 Tax=Clydaea vesicula TaxID=447962 RepID=A0AAD5U576_9FUNG|nr:hypothetical protein HK099_001299 [Clydaea vesicula]